MTALMTKMTDDKLQKLFVDVSEEMRTRRLRDNPDVWVEIKGQETTKRAIIVAAVARVPILLYGGRGLGKSMLVAAAARVGVTALEAWPCPCGGFTDHLTPCSCTAERIEKWIAKILRPMAKECGIVLQVLRTPPRELSSRFIGTTSDQAQEQIEQARPLVKPELIDLWKATDECGQQILKCALQELPGTLSRTGWIAQLTDAIRALSSEPNVQAHHLVEAIQYQPRWQ